MQGNFKLKIIVLFLCATLSVHFGCKEEKKGYVIGILQPVEDVTLDKVRIGFIDALQENGFSFEKGNVTYLYRNAQNDIATLGQIVDFFISENVDAIVANATVSFIAAASKTKTIPVFAMAAPAPSLVGLSKVVNGKEVVPPNLSGIYDTLTYIDDNLIMAKTIFPKAKKIGVVYNSAEPNSVNAMSRLETFAHDLAFTIIGRSVINSNEVQQAVEAVLNEGVEIFFALPDNTVFSTFETIAKQAEKKNIPILTSEIGLVKRGALVASGPDMYLWGYETGQMVAAYLQRGKKDLEKIRRISKKSKRKVYNGRVAKRLGYTMPSGYNDISKETRENQATLDAIDEDAEKE